MVFSKQYNKSLSASKRGEIALTFTLISLVLMLLGTAVGLGVQKTQDIRTNASGGAVCGKGCRNNSECGLDSISKSQTQCDFSQTPHICVSSNIPGNPRCPTGLKTCNQDCSKDSDCNSPLTCDRTLKVCQGSSCAPIATPTGYRAPTGGSGGAGGGDGSTIPTSTTAQTTGTALRVLELPCKVEFTFTWDPQLDKITITDPDNPSNIFSADNSNVDYTDPANQFGPIGKVVAFSSGGTAGIFVSFDPTNNNDIEITLNGGGGGLNSVVHYFFKRPAWLNGAARYNLDIDYEGKVGGVKHYWSQQARSKSCTSITPTVTITPTATPTPRPCNSTCYNDSDCLSHYCYKGELPPPNPDNPVPGHCRLNYSCRTSVNCSCTITPTITVTPTRTPTPTQTPTPSPTPTPTPCSKSVYFMIDSSSTQKANLPALESQLNSYFGSYKTDNVRFHYDTFNIVAPDQHGDGTNTISFKNIDTTAHWTNINEAFDVMGKAKADLKIFISDGVPSVLDADLNADGDSNNSINNERCVYTDKGATLHGCIPIAHSGSYTDFNTCITSSFKKRDIRKMCTTPYPITSSDADYAVYVEGDEKGIIDNVGLALKNSAKGLGLMNNIDEFIKKIPDIRERLCPSVPQNQPRQLMSSFTITNQSTTKSIQSVNVKACDKNGKNCQAFLNTVNVQPQAVARFSQPIAADIPAANRALVTCDVAYTGGTSLPCPRKATGDDSVQFNLSATSQKVSGNVRTFTQAADINHDGVVNAIDYVLCQQQISSTSKKSCDIVSDDLVNAQDISVVVDHLGQRAR